MSVFVIGISLLWGLMIVFIIANRISKSRNSGSFYRTRRRNYIESYGQRRTTNGDGGGWGGDWDGHDGDGDGNGGGNGGE